MRIRKGDMVQIISGDDAGKIGKIKRVLPKKEKVLIEGINYITKHLRHSQKNPKGGRIQMEAPIAISKVLPVCLNKSCKKYNRGVRIRIKCLDNGTKVRTCIKCGGELSTYE